MTTRITPLPYLPDPLLRYSDRVAQPYGFALTGGRYTLLGWDPLEVITQDHKDPFTYMNERMKGIASDLSPCGGWYGYIGYEFAETLHAHLPPRPRDLPIPDLCLGLYDQVHVYDHQTKSAYSVNHHLRHQPNSIEGTRPPLKGGFSLTPFTSNFTPESYRSAFEQAQAALQRGDCYQVNLAQRFTADFEGSPWEFFLRLMASNPSPFSAYFQLPEASILSCSPERFIRIQDREIETKPIKGTAPRSDDPAEDQACAERLRHSEKNRAENLMIVDLMRNDLGKLCLPGSVETPDLFTLESYRSVHHLVSRVRGLLRPEVTPLEALAACFPGGSITGAPKLAALQQIRRLEPHARHVYCGSLGYADFSGTLDMNIAIRTALVTQGQCHLWAGGGIVLDSVCEEEYQECLDKVGPMLGLARGRL